MNQELEIRKIQHHLEAIELLLNGVLKELSGFDRNSIGDDWVDQKTIMKLTGLGKTKLYELRRDNMITYSCIGSKGVFYRLSDF